MLLYIGEVQVTWSTIAGTFNVAVPYTSVWLIQTKLDEIA